MLFSVLIKEVEIPSITETEESKLSELLSNGLFYFYFNVRVNSLYFDTISFRNHFKNEQKNTYELFSFFHTTL